MTDEQIIKALECCSSRKNCEENCPYFELKENFFECVRVSTSDAIECIRRQQAEIDRLKANSKATESTLTKALKAIAYHETIDSYDGTENGDVVGTVCHDAYYVILGLKSRVKEARTEAIKEFGDKLKEYITGEDSFYMQDKMLLVYKINNLLKEMAGKAMRIDYSKTLNYSREFERMCDAQRKSNVFNDCSDSCPFGGFGNCSSMTITQEKIDIVQKWSDEHPQETMADRFFKMFPNAKTTSDGMPVICPHYIGWGNQERCPKADGKFESCTECWNRPYKGAVDNGI